MKRFVKEFKVFIATGNMIELAVAVILGAAVKAVIDSFTKDVMMQLIAAIGGKKDFSKLLFTVNNAQIFYGNVLTAILNLMLVGLVLFLMIKAYNHLKQRMATEAPEPDAPVVVSELSVLLEIRDALTSQR
ncbi:MAG: large conductance mechanosensitive channel protein MscL [Actinomycetota bacterium]|nr:large conductance mechanosensitive channel protein MscL [Actinomycetota bacterium]